MSISSTGDLRHYSNPGESRLEALESTFAVGATINNSTNDFQNENLTIKVKDYYFSNVIARSSKTMVECNNSKLNLKSTGTEG